MSPMVSFLLAGREEEGASGASLPDPSTADKFGKGETGGRILEPTFCRCDSLCDLSTVSSCPDVVLRVHKRGAENEKGINSFVYGSLVFSLLSFVLCFQQSHVRCSFLTIHQRFETSTLCLLSR